MKNRVCKEHAKALLKFVADEERQHHSWASSRRKVKRRRGRKAVKKEYCENSKQLDFICNSCSADFEDYSSLLRHKRVSPLCKRRQLTLSYEEEKDTNDEHLKNIKAIRNNNIILSWNEKFHSQVRQPIHRFKRRSSYFSSLGLRRHRSSCNSSESVASFSGENSISQLYICSACYASTEDLEEILLHKWENHPYCLVSHMTLLSGDPNCFLNRNSTGNPTNSSLEEKGGTCSKCSKSLKEGFYLHLLGCGGGSHEDEEEERQRRTSPRKRGRRRVLRSYKVGTPSGDENHRQVERERRRRRLELFSKPRPPSERFTRLQLKKPTPAQKPPLKVSNLFNTGEIIIDLFNPGELLVKAILEEVLNAAVFAATSVSNRSKPRRRRRGRPPGVRSKKNIPASTKRNTPSSFVRSANSSDPPFYAKKSLPTKEFLPLVFAKKSSPLLLLQSEYDDEYDEDENSPSPTTTHPSTNEFLASSSFPEAESSKEEDMVNFVEGNMLFSL